MKKKPTITSLQKQLKEKSLELEALKKDREIYRGFIVEEFRSQLANMTNNKYSDPSWMIKKMTAALNKAERFYIGL